LQGTAEEPGLRQFATVTAGVLEKREKIRHAQQGPQGAAQIDQFQLAPSRAAGDVESDQRPQACTVHEGNALEVEDDALFIGKQSANLGTKMWGVFGRQTSVTRDDGTWAGFAAARIHAKAAFRDWAGFG